MKNITKNKKRSYRKQCEDCSVEGQVKYLKRMNRLLPVCSECKEKRRLVTTNCIQCGDEFKTKIVSGRHNKCCSGKCAAAYAKSFRVVGLKSSKWWTRVKCDACGKEFDRRKKQVGERNYCNKVCHDNGLSNRIDVVCDRCGKTFKRNKRQQDKHKGTYCSRLCTTPKYRDIIDHYNCKVCSVSFNNLESTSKQFCSKGCRIIFDIDPMGFRIMVKSSRRKHATELSYPMLQRIYENQNGLCALTGIVMTSRKDARSPTTISVDRIHSDFGYIDHNIQLVCVAANYMKNDFTQKESMDFIKNIRQNGKG